MTPSLGPSSCPNRRDVDRFIGAPPLRLKKFRKIMPQSVTSRLVWVSATLYGDGVRRRCATRCPRPLVDLARHAAPPSAEAERWRRRPHPCPAIVGSLCSPPLASSSLAVGGRPPAPPGARFARGAACSARFARLPSYLLARRGRRSAAQVMAAIVAPTRTVTSSHRVVAVPISRPRRASTS